MKNIFLPLFGVVCIWLASAFILPVPARGAESASAKNPSVASDTGAVTGQQPGQAHRRKRDLSEEFSDEPAHDPEVPAGVLAIHKIPSEMKKKPAEEQPWFVRWMIHPQSRGMFVSIPVVDTDPNRGVTYGVMPIWVYQGKNDDRIRHINAPSITYNDIFHTDFTYRYYYYPTENSTLALRGDYSEVINHELFAEYQDYNFLDEGLISHFIFQNNVDGSGRYFGTGPNTPKTGESNYVNSVIQGYGLIGLPIWPQSRWFANFSHLIAGQKISNGPINTLPDIGKLYPGVNPAHYHQSSASRLALNFDDRDSPITTTRGVYWDLFAEVSQRDIASEYTYQRYGTDWRCFKKTSSDGKFITAGRVRFEQIIGDEVPFWLMPQLGGKYVNRAYGEGRYVDNGLLMADIEERYTFAEMETAGVNTKFEFAPFTGLGTVFNRVNYMARRYMRPAYGAAVRVIAPPQVVGSVDFGVGQEGLSVFTDINYSF